MANSVKHLLEFGPFRVDPEQRILWRDQQPVALSPKAFDLLLVLTQREGQVVLKDDLMKTLWPDTFVEESNLGQHVFQIRKALGERAQDSAYIVTVPGRGYRFAQKVTIVPAQTALPVRAVEDEEQIVMASRSLTRVVITGQKREWRLWLAGAAILTAILIAAGVYWRFRQKPKLTAKDTIMVADFANSTGDPVFDSALREGLSAQLAQSPFLNLLSDQRIGQTLSLMGHHGDEALKPEIAREVCQRTASAAVINGSIAQIGTRYLLILKAVSCSSGESIASTESEASDKNHVLDALGKIASQTRSELGESLASVQKYDVPPEDVTTPSLEALKAYSLGMQKRKTNLAPAIPLFERAITLDPNFAMAYAQLGVIFFNLDDTARAADNIRKAYELRDRVSEREKLLIASHYEDMVTRDLEASRKIYELMQQIYPRYGPSFNNLGTISIYLGDWNQVLTMTSKATALNGRKADPNVIDAYIYLNRLDDAKKMALEAQAAEPDLPWYPAELYLIGFLQQDTAGMQRALAQLKGNSEGEAAILNGECRNEAYFGHFSKSRELTTRLVDATVRTDGKPVAAVHRAFAASEEGLVGNSVLAREQANAALTLSDNREVEGMAAVALALSGDSTEALRLANNLEKAYPKDTVVHTHFLPAIRAAVALKAGDADKAIQSLQAASPYELGMADLLVNFSFYPVYLRGQAYLMARQGTAAAAEFQKILDHPGVVQDEVIGPLAHLGQARAYALSGEKAKAQSAYQDFFALWKNADPDLPILKEARKEFAKAE